MDRHTAPWGSYFPSRDTLLFRCLTQLGLSRGCVCRWIRGQWAKKNHTLVDAVIRGTKYRLDIQHNTTDAKILASSKFCDQQEIEALAPHGENREVFLDVGANTGYYSLSLAKLGYQRVIAIEPNPPTLDLLRFNVQLNDMENTISIVPMCIGEGGKIPFYGGSGLGDASLIQGDKTSEPIWVDSATLLDIIHQLSITRIDAMKIDIEGYEDRALEPYFKTAPKSLWPKTIVIEHCNQTDWKLDIIQYMKEIGYSESFRTRANLILKL